MPTPSPQEVTELLLAWNQGEEFALDKLIPLVYAELRRLAKRYMGRERLGHTLQTTALINEAYLRLIDARKVNWQNRAQFYGIAAKLMRRVLVDLARSRHFMKRGGEARFVSLDEGAIVSKEKEADFVALDEALIRLAEMDPRKSQVIELRFFGGLSVEETAEVLNTSPRTVMREWSLAQAWLLRELTDSGPDAIKRG